MPRFILHLILLFAVTLGASAQSHTPVINRLIAVQYHGRYGYINYEGDTVIPFMYREAGKFYDGLAPVRMQSQYGYIDTLGRTVIPTIYDEACFFIDGKVAVRKNGIIYVMDTGGNLLYKTEGSDPYLTGPYLMFDDPQEKTYVLSLEGDKQKREVVDFGYLSDQFKLFLLQLPGLKFEIIDAKGKVVLIPPHFDEEMFPAENNNYLLLPQSNRRTKYLEPTSLFLYAPDGRLVKEIKSSPGYAFNEYDFKTYDTDLTKNSLFLIVEEGDGTKPGTTKPPRKVWVCDSLGNPAPLDKSAIREKNELPPQDGSTYVNPSFEIYKTEEGKPYIRYSSGRTVMLADTCYYSRSGNLIHVYRHVTGKGAFDGMLDTALRPVLPFAMYTVIRFEQGHYGIQRIWNQDSLWYFNPAGKKIWAVSHGQQTDSIYQPQVDSWDLRSRIISENKKDSVTQNMQQRVPAQYWEQPRMVYVDTVTKAGDNYFRVYFRNKSLGEQSVFLYPKMQVKDTAGQWKYVGEYEERFRCQYSVPPSLLLGKTDVGISYIPIYRGAYATEMRLEFQWRKPRTSTKPQRRPLPYVKVYSNPFPVGINPNDLY